MGLRGQGRARRQGRDHLLRAQFPRQDHGRHFHVLFRPGARGLRTVPGGFRNIPFGDADALAAAIGPHTAAFLVEPIQGEAGIIVPPPGYLRACATCAAATTCSSSPTRYRPDWDAPATCSRARRTMRVPTALCWQGAGRRHGPGFLFLARRDVMDVFRPGDHGSTFGGYPLAAAVGHEALCVMEDEQLCQRSRETGGALKAGLQASLATRCATRPRPDDRRELAGADARGAWPMRCSSAACCAKRG